MEFATQKTIKRSEIWILDLPNLKEWCFVPHKLEFWTISNQTKTLVEGSGDIEVSFFSGQNCLYKWGLPYFKIYNYLDLSLFLNKIGEGENVNIQIKNLDKEEKELTLKIIYKEYQGNIIYYNSYDNSLINGEQSNPLHDLAGAGLVTNIQIQSDCKMKGIILEPIFHIKEEDSPKLRGFPINSIVVEAEEPTSVIEIGLEQLQEYQNAMKYFRLKVLFDSTVDSKESKKSKLHIVAHGFKN